MPYPILQSPAGLWALARAQHGAVSREQLVGMGMHPQAVKRRIASGRLHPVRPGVYAVGRPELTRHGVWMAAVLSCGPGAALSHGSAAQLWELLPQNGGAPIHISLPGGVRRRQPGVATHRRNIGPTDLTRRHNIPVTSPTRTLIDLALIAPRSRLEAAINEADKLGFVNPETLRKTLESLRGHPGVAALRTTLDRRTFTLADTELERRFARIARRAGLPPPLTQRRVNGFRVDFYWPDLGLVVETDGLRYHRTPAQQTADLRRDQRHSAAGLTPLRFSHAQVAYEPEYVAAMLKDVAQRLRTGAPAAARAPGATGIEGR